MPRQKRIRFKIGGKLVNILRSDWDVLKRRFDHKNAKEGLTRFEIKVDCPLCRKFLNEILGTCKGCTFDKFKTEDGTGCGNALRTMLEEQPQFTTSEWCVYFFKNESSRACVQLNRLLAFMARREEESDAAEKK